MNTDILNETEILRAGDFKKILKDFKSLSLKMVSAKRACPTITAHTTKFHATCCFPAEALGRRV